MSNILIISIAALAIFITYFLLILISQKRVAPLITFFLIVSTVLFVLALLEQLKVIDLGLQRIESQASEFYLSNSLYFGIGYAIIFIFTGGLMFVNVSNAYTVSGKIIWIILSILLLAFGAYCIFATVFALNGMEPFASWAAKK